MRSAVLARFALVSLVGTGVDFLVLWLLVAHAGWAPVPAKLVAIEATIVNTFIWNNAWTFRGRGVTGSLAARFLSFNLTSATGFVFAVGAVGALTVVYGPRYYLLYNLATLPVNVVWNYLWSTRVIWRGQPQPMETGPALAPSAPVERRPADAPHDSNSERRGPRFGQTP